VQITQTADGSAATLFRLVHDGLPLPSLSAHREGWNHYVDRLAVAGGGDPVPVATAGAPPT
jgi:hypothetical protein